MPLPAAAEPPLGRARTMVTSQLTLSLRRTVDSSAMTFASADMLLDSRGRLLSVSLRQKSKYVGFALDTLPSACHVNCHRRCTAAARAATPDGICFCVEYRLQRDGIIICTGPYCVMSYALTITKAGAQGSNVMHRRSRRRLCRAEAAREAGCTRRTSTHPPCGRRPPLRR
jgi:hypothetical protein